MNERRNIVDIEVVGPRVRVQVDMTWKVVTVILSALALVGSVVWMAIK